MNRRRLLGRILSGAKNIRFGDMADLVEAFGFRLSRVNYPGPEVVYNSLCKFPPCGKIGNR